MSGGNYSGGLAGEALRSNITNCFAQSTGGRSGFVDSATRFNNGIDNPNIFYASDSNDSYAKKLFSTSMLPAGVTATYTGNNYYTVTLGGNTFYQTGATFKLSYDGTVPEGYYGVDGLKAYGQPLTKNADGTYTFIVNLENTYKGRAIEYQAQPAITGFPYDSATKTYTISSKDDLKRLSDHVKEGGNTSGLTFKLMADIDDVDFQIGDKTGNSFKGIFDGNGHKITVNISKDNNAALFYRVENGTIKDLTLEGNITAQNQYVAAASSFIDTSGGNVSILNCTSNVSIKSYNSMDSYSGGFVSYNRSGTLNLKNCTFGGKLDVGGYSGGFVGLNESITNVDSCIFMPEAASFNGNSNCATFVQNRRLVAGGNEGFATVKNSYHTQTFGDNPNGSTEIRSQVTEGFTRSSIINGVTVYFASQGLEALVGDGTAENPYQLNGQSSLNKLAEHIRTGGSTAGLHFILTDNFSYGGSIGNTSNPFQGTLDGNGKTLTATGSALFGAIKDATVKNLAISGSISDRAALSNSTAGNVSLDNVYCNSTVSAKNFYGLLGSVDDGATLNFNNVFLRIGTSGRVNLHSPVGSKAGSVSVNGNVYYAYCDFSSADGIKVIEVDIPGGVDVTCNDADKFVRDSTTYYKIGAELNLNADMTKYEFADIPQAVSAGSGKFTYTVAEQNQLSFESYPKINGITFDADSKTYTISNAAELNALAAYVNAGNTCAGYNFKVTADINMSGESFTPIGTEGNSFRGNFDGNGLTISGLTSGDYNYVGLFGENYGTIQNVNLDNVNFNVGTCVGAIAAHNSGSIKNCSASGYVNGMNWVGGLVAENDGGYVQNSFSNVKADSGSSLVGNNQGIVSGCSYVENGAFDSTGSTKLCTLNLPKGIEITCDASKMKVFNGVAYYVPNTEVTLTLTDDFKASYKNSSVGLKGLTQNADGTYKLTVADNVTVEAQGEEVVKGLLFSTADNAFIIETAADLQALANYVNGGGNTLGYNFKVTADIDVSGITFTPIGNVSANSFKGTFDGDNHYIRNLTMDGTGAAGLFGYVNGGTIQKVKLSNADITADDYAGGIVAYNEGGTVRNCFVDGTITGNGEVGAIVGFNEGGTYSGNYYHSNATNGSIPKRSRKAAENDFTRVYELGELPAGVTAEFVGNEEEYTFTVEIDGEVKTYYKAGATFTLTLDSSKFSDCEKVTLNNCTLNEDGTYTYTIPENFAETDIVFTTFEFPKIDGLEFVDDGTGGYYKLNSMSDIAAMLTVDRKDLTFTLANDKFNITSEDELNALADFVNNGGDTSGITFTLTKDFDFTDKTFKPIGDAANPFKGTFNGNGKTISNINYAANSASVGLFGVNSGTITDVVLADCTFESVAEDGVVGSIVGNNSGTVKNSFFAGGTLKGYNVGAIAGVNSGTLTDNYYYGDYSGNGTRVYKLTLPEGVTASSEHLTEYGGEYYAPAGEQISFTIGDDADTSSFVKVTGLNVNLDYSMPAQDVDNLNITGYPKIDGLEFDATGNYYKIQNYTDLQTLATYVNAGNICEGLTFKQTKDIDMSSVENFTPINNLAGASPTDNFAGTFDGQGNVISNLTITKGGYEEMAALFGLNRGTIQNVKLLNANISAYSGVAGIAVKNYGTIENCFVDGTIHDTCGNNQFKAVVYNNDMMSDPTNPEVLPVEPKVENCYYHVDATDDYATKVYELTINPHFTISDASNAFVIGGKVFGAGEVSFKLTADDSRRVIDGSDTYSANISADKTVTTNYHIQLDDGGESFTVDSDGAISVLGGNGDDTITNYNDDITIAGGAGNNVINLRGGTGTVIDTDGGDDLINVLGVESFRVQGFGVGDSIAGVATEIETVAGGIKAGDVTINGLSKGDRYNEWQIADSVGKYVPVSVEGAFVDDGAIIYQDAAQGSALVELNGLTSSPEVSGTTIELTGANFASDISVTDNTNGYEFKLTDASGKTFKGSTNGDIITVAGDGVTIDLSGDDVVKVAAGVTSFTVTNFGADDRLVFADTVTDATYADNALSVTVGSNVITINGMPAPTVEDNAWLRATNGNAVFGKSAGNIYTVNGNYINYASQDAETYFELDGLRDDVTTEQLATAITVDGKTITVNSEDILDASKEVELSGAGYSFEAGEAIPKSRYNATGNWTADATDTSKFTYESAGVTSGWIISNNKLRHNINTVKTFTLSGLANTDAENIFVDDKSGTVDINKTAASGEAIQLVDNAGNYQIVLSAPSADENFGGKKFIGTANDDTITINVDNAVVDAGNGFDTLIIGAGVMSLKVENFDATEDKIQFSGAMSGVKMIDGKLVVTSEGGNVSIEGVSGSVDLPTWIHGEDDEALKAKLFAGKSAGVYLAEDGMSLINRAEPEVSEEVLAEFNGVTGDPTVTGKTITFAANNFGDGKEISVLDNSGEYAFIVGNEGSSKKFIGTTGKDTITITGSELTLDGKGGGDDIFVTVSRSDKNLYLENFGADDKIQLLDEDGTALTPEITDYSSPNVKSFVATTDKGTVYFNGFGAYTGEQSVDWSIDGGNAKLFNATLGGASLNDDGAIVYKAGNVDPSNILFELSGLKNKYGLSLDTSEGLLNLTGNDNFDDEINIVTGGNYKVVLNQNISGKKLIGSNTADNFNNVGASNTIVGGAGNDSIYSYADNVSIDGGAGSNEIHLVGGTGVTVKVADGSDVINVHEGMAAFTVEDFDANDKFSFEKDVKSTAYDATNGLTVTLADDSTVAIKGMPAPSEVGWLSVENGTATYGKTAGNNYLANGTELTCTENAAATNYFTLSNLKADATAAQIESAIAVADTTITIRRCFHKRLSKV